jgi:hypothetical protein
MGTRPPSHLHPLQWEMVWQGNPLNPRLRSLERQAHGQHCQCSTPLPSPSIPGALPALLAGQ